MKTSWYQNVDFLHIIASVNPVSQWTFSTGTPGQSHPCDLRSYKQRVVNAVKYSNIKEALAICLNGCSENISEFSVCFDQSVFIQIKDYPLIFQILCEVLGEQGKIHQKGKFLNLGI